MKQLEIRRGLKGVHGDYPEMHGGRKVEGDSDLFFSLFTFILGFILGCVIGFVIGGVFL